VRLTSQAAATAFASVVLFTLPFSHSVALRLAGLLGAWVCLAFAWRQLDVPCIPLLRLLAAWAALGGISLFWAVDREYSASELKSEVLYATLVYVLFFVLTNLERLERFRRVILLATAASFASALHWTLWGGAGSTDAFFNGPGMYSTYLAMAYPFVLVWALDGAQSARARLVHALLLAGIFAGAAITLNRAIWIALALQSVLVVALHRAPPLGRWRTRTRLAAALAALLVLAGSFYAVSVKRTPPTQTSAIGNFLDDPRIEIWRWAAARIAEDPLFGAGFGRGAARAEIRATFGHRNWEHAHNTVLNYGLAMGVGGIAIVLALFGVVLTRFVRLWRDGGAVIAPYALAGVAMVAGLFVKLMFDDFFYRQTTLFYFAVTGMLLGAHARLRRTPGSAPPTA